MHPHCWLHRRREFVSAVCRVYICIYVFVCVRFGPCRHDVVVTHTLTLPLSHPLTLTHTSAPLLVFFTRPGLQHPFSK